MGNAWGGPRRRWAAHPWRQSLTSCSRHRPVAVLRATSPKAGSVSGRFRDRSVHRCASSTRLNGLCGEPEASEAALGQAICSCAGPASAPRARPPGWQSTFGVQTPSRPRSTAQPPGRRRPRRSTPPSAQRASRSRPPRGTARRGALTKDPAQLLETPPSFGRFDRFTVDGRSWGLDLWIPLGTRRFAHSRRRGSAPARRCPQVEPSVPRAIAYDLPSERTTSLSKIGGSPPGSKVAQTHAIEGLLSSSSLTLSVEAPTRGPPRPCSI